MFTVWLAASVDVNDSGDIVACRKEKPVILFKGTPGGRIEQQISSEKRALTYVTKNAWQNGDTYLLYQRITLRKLSI